MKQNRDRVFHVLGEDDIGNLIKLQGKKKSIAAFYRMEADSLEDGVQSGGAIVAELEGKVLFSGEEDVMSKPDKTGRRWIAFDVATGENKGEQPIHAQIKKDFEKMISDILKKEKVKHPSNIDGTLQAWSNYGNNSDGKTKARLIKGYFDGLESILKNKKYQDAISKNFYGYMKDKSGDMGSWDEQIVNEISIKKFHFLEEALEWAISREPKELSKGIPFKIWSTAEDLEAYIAKTARK
tara:strand:- start:359 stop:1075 length:717 start_codon:yes stop_codon:yes gene_type:complete